MRSSLSLPLTFIFSFIFFVLIYGLKYPLDHHAYIRIIEQNIAACSTWDCFRVSSFGHNMRGGLFVHYLFRVINGWLGGVNSLAPNLVASAFFNSFFIMSLFYFTAKKFKDLRQRSLWFFGFFIASPLILRQIFTIEDNITYYGFFVFYLYFQFNKRFGENLDGLLSGLFLGLAIWMHLSPLIFLFTLGILPFSFFNHQLNPKKIFITLFSALFIYYFLHIATHFDHFWNGSFTLALSQTPLHAYILKAISFEMGASSKELNYLRAVLIGFEDMNYPDGFRALGYIAWSILFVFLGLNFKNIKLNWLALLVGLLSLGPVFIYEPQFGERWDFFIIALYLFLISTQKEYSYKPLIVLFLSLQAINTGAMSVAASPLNNQKSKLVIEFKEALKKASKAEYIILDKKFLRIDPFIISEFPGKERDVFFSDGERFYQTTFSLIARGIIPQEELWSHIHFDAWSSQSPLPEPKGIQEVSIGCDISHKENVYISESLIESLKKSCP